ncbi:hypothetical protein BDAP_000691 [Binucleata daphniae]
MKEFGLRNRENILITIIGCLLTLQLFLNPKIWLMIVCLCPPFLFRFHKHKIYAFCSVLLFYILFYGFSYKKHDWNPVRFFGYGKGYKNLNDQLEEKKFDEQMKFTGNNAGKTKKVTKKKKIKKDESNDADNDADKNQQYVPYNQPQVLYVNPYPPANNVALPVQTPVYTTVTPIQPYAQQLVPVVHPQTINTANIPPNQQQKSVKENKNKQTNNKKNSGKKDESSSEEDDSTTSDDNTSNSTSTIQYTSKLYPTEKERNKAVENGVDSLF